MDASTFVRHAGYIGVYLDNQQVVRGQHGRSGHRSAAFFDRLPSPTVYATPASRCAAERGGFVRLQGHELILRAGQHAIKSRAQYDCIGWSFNGGPDPERIRHPARRQDGPLPTVGTMTSPAPLFRGGHQ